MKKVVKKQFRSSPVGYSVLLTVMVILVLVVFGVLSLVTSLRDYKYSERIAEKTTAYYEANSAAYDIFRQIDETIAQSATPKDAWQVISEIAEVTVLTEDEMSANVYYEVEITTHQKLQVMLEINAEEMGQVSYKILKWKEISSESWENDTRLPVMGSE